MDAEAITVLTNKLEAIAVKAGPLLDTLIAQVQAKGIARAVLGLTMVFGPAVIFTVVFRKREALAKMGSEAQFFAGTTVAICTLVLLLGGVCELSAGISQWIAPLPHLLGK